MEDDGDGEMSVVGVLRGGAQNNMPVFAPLRRDKLRAHVLPDA